MPDIKDLENDLSEMERGMVELISGFNHKIGKTAVTILKRNFDMQGYDSGNSFEPWQERSPATDRYYDGHYGSGGVNVKKGSKNVMYSSKNPILLQSHNLKDSLDYKATKTEVDIGVFGKTIIVNGDAHNSEVYGKQNNEGEGNVPQRQFMPTPAEGENQVIRQAIFNTWSHEETRIMKKFDKT